MNILELHNLIFGFIAGMFYYIQKGQLGFPNFLHVCTVTIEDAHISVKDRGSIFASNVCDPKAQASTDLNALFLTFLLPLALCDVTKMMNQV